MSVLIKGFKIPTGDEPRMFLTHFNDDGTADMIAMGYPQKPYSLVEVPEDVQPVVRCKDCQYWQESRYGIIEMNACLRFDGPFKDSFIFEANAEDFCSFAKRRVET